MRPHDVIRPLLRFSSMAIATRRLNSLYSHLLYACTCSSTGNTLWWCSLHLIHAHPIKPWLSLLHAATSPPCIGGHTSWWQFLRHMKGLLTLHSL